MSQVLLTGATGFVGGHLLRQLHGAGMTVRCAVRSLERGRSQLGSDANLVVVGKIGRLTDWRAALSGASMVIHLAARAHILEDDSADPLAEFLEVNTEGTLNLAKTAAAVGVKRFVYLSSVKVNGESSGERGYSASDVPSPADPYGESKLRAERGLSELASETGMETVVIRPPLVYGPGVGANFLRLMRLVERGIPLPVGSVRNERSLVSVWNLCDLIVKCATSPAAANRTFMVSDGVDLSTPELVRRIASALQCPARILAVPPALLRLAARLTGQMAEYTRLCASLKVNMNDTLSTLDWRPPCSVDESLKRTASWYRGPR